MTNNARIAKNSAALIIARIVTKLGTTAVLIVAARLFGKEEFGTLSSVLAFTAFFGLIQEFGMTVPLIRKIARGGIRPGEELGDLLVIKTFTGIFAFTLLVICARFYNIPIPLALAFGVSSFFEMQALSIVRSFEGVEQMKYSALLTVLERSVFFVLGMAVLASRGGMFELAIVYICSNGILVATGLWLFSKKLDRITVRLRPHQMFVSLRESLPFFFAGILSLLYNRTDIYFLTSLRSPSEVGWYSAAYRIIDAQMFVPVAVVGAVFPVLTRIQGSPRPETSRIFRNTFVLLFCLGMVAAAFSWLLKDDIIGLLYGRPFAESALPLGLLSLMLGFYYANFLLGSTLIAVGKENLATVTIGVGAVWNIVADAVLTRSWGMEGVSVGRLTTEVVAFVLQLLLLHKIMGLRNLYGFAR